MFVIIFIIILLVLVLVHESGHFFTAKKFGVKVEEFGFGLPPRLFGWKKEETEYTLNLLPIGGFVKILGENPNEEDSAGPDASRSLIHKPKWQQALILFAGIFANFLLAWLLLSFGFMIGMPTSLGSEPTGITLSNVHLEIISVEKKSPAENAGLKVGDKIVEVKSLPQDTPSETLANINPDTLKSFVMSHSAETLEIGYLRGANQEIKKADVVPAFNKKDDQPEIGIAMDQIGNAKLPFFRAFYEGLVFDWSITKYTAEGLYSLIAEALRGKGSLDSVSGIVGAASMTGEAYQFGFAYLLSFAAMISVNLAIINLFPIPALDGGRLLFLLIEKIKGSRLNPKVTNTINTIGFVFLIILMIVVTYHDILVKFF